MSDNSAGNKWMQAFFSPAVALMSRLNIGRKFALLGLMSLTAMGVVAYNLFASLDEDINFLQRELEGIRLVEPFPRVMQTLQQANFVLPAGSFPAGNEEFLVEFLRLTGYVNIRRVQKFGYFEDTSSMMFKDVAISVNMIAEKA